MYKVLIVDDELLVRVGLKTMIKWNELGFSVVGEASTAEHGYIQYEKLKPDLIFVDIKMPKKNGLWLTETIRKVDTRVKIIMLTCLDDFTFAREALKKGADDYILKSEIENDELALVIKEMKKTLDATIDRDTYMPATDKLSIKRNILDEMINVEFHIDENLKARCIDVDFIIENSKKAFVIASINEDDIKRMQEKDIIQSVSRATLNIILTHLADKGIEFLYKDNLKNYLLVLSCKSLNINDLTKIFNQVCSGVKQYFDITLRIIFTSPFSNLEDLKAKYDELYIKNNIGFYLSKSNSEIIVADTVSFGQISILEYGEKYNNGILNSIGEKDTDNVKEKLKEIEEKFSSQKANPKSVKAFFCNLMVDIIKRYSQFFADGDLNYIYYHNTIMNLEHIEDVMQVVEDVALAVNNYVGSQRSGGTKLLINKAISFIEENYGQNISLEDVAEKLIISKYYLSAVFKKETGMNMSLYINQVRVEKAKQLMMTSNAKSKEIFDLVGFSNQQYFSKVFKKITGKTIMEYKEEISKKDR